ncbi:MAG: YcfL family protein [Betaproteobacteria bacterium]|nr:YcfL family protein [Betaproteobacteria bacterium]
MKKMIALLALGAACAGVCQPIYAADGGSIASKVEELGKIDSLTVTDMRAARRDNLLRIQFTVTNSSPKNEQLYYRFRWLDADGFTVWDEEPWKPEIIYGKQDKVLNAIAPTFKAVDFKLELQSPHNSTTSERTGAGDNPPYR